MASNLLAVLKELPDFDATEFPELCHLLEKVTELQHVESFLTVLKRSKLSPKQVNYLNLPWLDGLYQAYYRVHLATNTSDTVPERTRDPSIDLPWLDGADPSIDLLALDLLMLPSDYPESMIYLLRQGLAPDATLGLYTRGFDFCDDDSILELAIKLGKLQTAEVLLSAGARVDLRVVYEEDRSNPQIFQRCVEIYLQSPSWHGSIKERDEDLRMLRAEIDPGSDAKDPEEEALVPPGTMLEKILDTKIRPKKIAVRLEYLHILDAASQQYIVNVGTSVQDL
jgi:hypothetical protein